MPPEPIAKLSCDTGGTFTDLVLEAKGERWTTKVLTTADAPERGVLEGIEELLALAGLPLSGVGLFIHGTTLATNALLERRGARTALLATDGFRDVIEIATENRYDQYDLNLTRRAPLVPRDLRFPVRERVDVNGRVRLALDEGDVRAVAQELRRRDIQSVAVSYIHAYANEAHERRTRDILAEMLPGVMVSLSCEVCPEIREYERTSTTVANAYVRPPIDRYLSRLDAEIRSRGFGGALCIMTSGGGLMSVDMARQMPVRIVESGPAGGAVFAARIAEQMGERRAVAFDMGGTTAKICLIEDFKASQSRVFEVDRTEAFRAGSGLPLRIPSIEMVEIGAGGGSIASVDALGRVGVGPHSASSDPGPACYGRGGQAPTVTDADVTLGLIDPEGFAGGTIDLKPELAAGALRGAVGEKLGLSDEDSARGVYEMVCETMAAAARAHTTEKGSAPNFYSMIAFGGAAPLHVARVAERLGVARVIVPRNAGVGSAIGFLAAPAAHAALKTRYMLLENFDAPAASVLLREMASETRAFVATAALGAELHESRIAFMRYVGQGHEIAVELPARDLEQGDAAMIHERFEAGYQALFKRAIPGAAIEILAWSVEVATRPAAPAPQAAAVTRSTAACRDTVGIYDLNERARIFVPRYRRADLSPGAAMPGPAIIAEEETSTYVTRAFDAWIDATGAIVMDRKAL